MNLYEQSVHPGSAFLLLWCSLRFLFFPWLRVFHTLMVGLRAEDVILYIPVVILGYTINIFLLSVPLKH